MRLPHVIPFARTPRYFFTACTEGRRKLIASQSALLVLGDIWRRSAELDGWWVGRFVLMPDHVHFFATSAPRAKPMGEWHKMWKGVSARYLIRELGVSAPFWQQDTFDHILRSRESYEEKWNYVRENPVRAGLCGRADEWLWQGEIHAITMKDE
jgi:putative transposase